MHSDWCTTLVCVYACFFLRLRRYNISWFAVFMFLKEKRGNKHLTVPPVTTTRRAGWFFVDVGGCDGGGVSVGGLCLIHQVLFILLLRYPSTNVLLLLPGATMVASPIFSTDRMIFQSVLFWHPIAPTHAMVGLAQCCRS